MTSQWHNKTELMLQLLLYIKGLHGVEPAADVGSTGHFMAHTHQIADQWRFVNHDDDLVDEFNYYWFMFTDFCFQTYFGYLFIYYKYLNFMSEKS